MKNSYSLSISTKNECNWLETCLPVDRQNDSFLRIFIQKIFWMNLSTIHKLNLRRTSIVHSDWKLKDIYSMHYLYKCFFFAYVYPIMMTSKWKLCVYFRFQWWCWWKAVYCDSTRIQLNHFTWKMENRT